MSEVQILSPRPNRTSCVPAAHQAQPLFFAPQDKPSSDLFSVFARAGASPALALFLGAPDKPSTCSGAFSNRAGGSSTRARYRRLISTASRALETRVYLMLGESVE
jgi:hypothetical protein